MRRKRKTAETLRRAVDCLPERTRRAMLQAVEADSIIAGAYTAPNGGVCPMLAAHRRGGRTDLASFARAWDRYTGAKRARQATTRELRALRTMLEASLIASDAVQTDLTLAVEQVKRERVEWAEAEAATARAEAERAAAEAARRRPTGETDRTPELRRRRGWAWTRPVRRLDAYEAAVAQARREESAEEREVTPA